MVEGYSILYNESLSFQILFVCKRTEKFIIHSNIFSDSSFNVNQTVKSFRMIMYNIHYHNFPHNYCYYNIRGGQELTTNTLFRTLSLEINYERIKRPG